MTDKFVVRLLDENNALLSWAEVYAESRPQPNASCPFWAKEPTRFYIEASGMAKKISVHWCDLDIARVQDIPETKVGSGQIFDFGWIEPVWLISGMRDVPLPAVTVGNPVSLGVPIGSLGAKAP